MAGKHEEAHKEHINKYKMAHMIGVAEYMRERAADYNKGYIDGEPIHIDPDEAYVIGLMHDIGYLIGRHDHEQTGAELLSRIGFKQEYVEAINDHGSNPYLLQERYGKDVISPMLVLLYEADLSVGIQGYRIGFDKRLADIAERNRGTEYEEAAITTSTAAVQFVKEWQAEHGIDKPSRQFWHHHDREVYR